jgi:hypothetical protein
MAQKIGSPLVAAVESAWHAIQRRHPELPDVLVRTGPSRSAHGHYHHDLWAAPNGRTPELFVAGQRFADGAEKTFNTILHEGTHGLAAATGVKDTSRGGRYHNRRFVEVAERLGMVYQLGKPSPGIGYSAVVMTAETRRRYAPAIERLDKAIRHHLERVPTTGGAGSRLLKATCGCTRIIRASAAVLAGAPIVCSSCRAPFTAEL